MEVLSKILPLSKLENNTGQIDGVPKNPRFIKDARYQKLKQSVIEDPEMLTLRELLVFPLNNKFVVIAGNQRLQVCRELKFKETLCKILPADTPIEKLKRYIIKDNIPFGEADWDALANEWDEKDLIDWGLEIPFFDNDQIEKLNDTDYAGMPEFVPGDKPFMININFRTEDDRQKFIELTKLKFSKKFEKQNSVWSAWWPDRERMDMKSLRFEENVSTTEK